MAPSSSSSGTTSVQVALRIRPQTPQDAVNIPTRFQRPVIHAISNTTVSVEGSTTAPGATLPASGSSGKKQVFNFDQAHGPTTTQFELYTSTAKPLISRFVEGYNCTILAYGQTSSGKTFTMTGIDLDADPSDPDTGMGIIPRAVSNIFAETRAQKEDRGDMVNFSVKGSFIEIYNEDLIDLLSMEDGNGGKREVQIREDKSGHIIWGGVREVPVKNTNDVMRLLRQGTAIRRTNETDMNAQSSRSHAIFSLTLTQKKYSGSGAPPRSSSPQLVAGRSPSRLARPGSTYAPTSPATTSRIASPTFGRPATPSFASAMGRGSLRRPSSSLGIHNESRASVDDDPGEWVTLVSKFHFVDLAGSERIKRTAAVGERVKEGISINSGLLALGNVISALGDPARAKSNTATHIPYRDSKLTRLLQDSLGGNTHTLMIACVSPAEYNAAETVNTLKYANRARNIKNKAVLNEKEDGWDDLEWLQGTVTRLRKELKSLKDGGAVPATTDTTSAPTEGASKQHMAQLNDMRVNYDNLRAKFVQRTEELTRLRQELGEKHRNSTNGSMGGPAKYEEIVGPVIEEYEKTIESMEAALRLNQAALRHTNELVEEKEEELTALAERHTATEMYLEELKSRATKLQERESSTEAYIRDLEEKIKVYEEKTTTSSESMSDLKREVSRFKDVESNSISYITDLETRLAKADESVLSLQQTTERLERECERRRTEAEILQTRLDTMKQDGENWRNDLEDREKRVKMLEKKMEEWQLKKQEAGEARERLGHVAAHARRSLTVEVPNDSDVSLEPGEASPTVNGHDTSDTATPPSGQADSAEEKLIGLQQTHTATLADLASISAKYRDALREISDLAAQIQEAKLSTVSDSPEEKTVPDTPSRRRMAGGRTRELSEPLNNAQGRRLFFRQAASTESLHSRSLSQSQSLSQELCSARSRNTSLSSHGASSSISHSPMRSNSPSLPNMRPNLSISLPSSTMSASSLYISTGERSVSSLEKEVMRLQEVLKEREAEITALEKSLNATQTASAPNGSHSHSSSEDSGSLPNGINGITYPNSVATIPELQNGMETPENVEQSQAGSVSEVDEDLDRFNELMRQVSILKRGIIDYLLFVYRSMAQKESQHREIVDDLNTQLTALKRQHDDLTALSRDQATNMSGELDALHKQYSGNLAELEATKSREAELLEKFQELRTSHASSLESLTAEHALSISEKEAASEQAKLQIRQEHDAVLSKLQTDLDDTTKAMQAATEEHSAALQKLRASHEEAIKVHAAEAQETLSRVRQEHETILADLQAEHAEILKRKETESSTTEEEYYDALTKVRADHAQSLEKQSLEHAQSLERLREEHAQELKTREVASDGLMSESQSSQAVAIANLQSEHAASLARKESAFATQLEQLKGEHERALSTKEEDFRIVQSKLRAESERVANQLREEWRTEADKLRGIVSAKEAEIKALEEAAAAHEGLLKDAHGQREEVSEKGRLAEEELSRREASHQEALKDLGSKHDAQMQSLTQEHQAGLQSLKAEHELAKSNFDTDLAAAQQQHQTVLESMKQASEAASAENERLASSLAALERTQAEENLSSKRAQEQLEVDLASLRTQHEETLALHSARQSAEEAALAEKDRLDSLLQDLQRSHSEEREAFERERGLLNQELEKHQAAAADLTSTHNALKETHESSVQQKDLELSTLRSQIDQGDSAKTALEEEVLQLRTELNQVRSEQSKLLQDASKRDSLVDELEKHRSIIAEMQDSLQKVKDQKDTLQLEKNKQDALVKDLQAQVARASSPPVTRSGQRPGVSPSKLPPPTPPPSIPPPPAPRSMHHAPDHNISISSQSSAMTSASSRESQLDSPITSIGHPSANGLSLVAPDSKITTVLEQQAKQIEEQETMIKTLNKQLTHCETDLQTHMDIVSTLETSLGDSEKNLRKARMQATEMARERDTLNSKLEALRNELNETKREVVTVRRSVVEEKQSLEQRLDEERKAKERARAQLDSRMDELTKRKSKFACL